KAAYRRAAHEGAVDPRGDRGTVVVSGASTGVFGRYGRRGAVRTPGGQRGAGEAREDAPRVSGIRRPSASTDAGRHAPCQGRGTRDAAQVTEGSQEEGAGPTGRTDEDGEEGSAHQTPSKGAEQASGEHGCGSGRGGRG